MTTFSLPIEGGCLCGAVRFTVSAPPMLTMACHCTGCQKMSASAFSLTVAVPSAAFETSGATEIGGLHRENAHHHHCADCKCWVFTRIEPDMGFVNVRATMLDDHADFAPFLESFTDEKLPWATTGAPHSYPGMPPMEDYPKLLEAFAAR